MKSLFHAPDWAHQTNIYEVNLRQYSSAGTFAAFENELPRLKAMGVETLWFMPLTPIAAKNQKGSLGSYYACADYTSINPEFGTEADLLRLIDNAHALGFKIIIDWVANHTGWDHVWTVEHPDYYLLDPATSDFQMASGMDDIIELNYDNPAMRTAMIAAMEYWVSKFHIDGFRCDLASWVTLDFWKAARQQLDAIRPLFWLGEFDELENPEYQEAFDASYSWAWMHKTEEFYREKISLPALVALLKKYDDLGDNSMRIWFTSNHDENSWNGTEYEKYGDMAIPLAVFSLSWNGIPLIYSGQELPNKKRLAFFDRDPIEWSDNREMEHFYETLLKLHARHPALRAGDPSVQTYILKTSAEAVFAFIRKTGTHEILVLLNFSALDVPHLKIMNDELSGVYKNVFNGEGFDSKDTSALTLEPWGYLVCEK
jgi:alpha-amylase